MVSSQSKMNTSLKLNYYADFFYGVGHFIWRHLSLVWTGNDYGFLVMCVVRKS